MARHLLRAVAVIIINRFKSGEENQLQQHFFLIFFSFGISTNRYISSPFTLLT